MRKLIFTLCLCTTGAINANAQGIVYAEEKFDWIQPFSETFGLGDPVGTDNAETKGIDLEPKNNNRVDGKNPMDIFWNDLGYRVRIWPNSACYEIFVHKNYLRLGGNEARGYGIQTAGIRWLPKNGNADVPDYPDELYLSFDWCPYKTAEGVYDEIELQLETRPRELLNTTEIKHDLTDGEPMRWIHVELDLYETLNYMDPAITRNTSYMLEPISEYQNGGKHRWYVDNFMLHSEHVDMSGISDVAVDNNTPVEYYNLQGTRLSHPTSGILIRKKGSETRTICFK